MVSHLNNPLSFTSLISRFTDPLKYGDYPQLLKDIRGDILPKFTDEEKALVKGSTDFLA